MTYQITYKDKETKELSQIEVSQNELGKTVANMAKKSSEVIIIKIDSGPEKDEAQAT